MSRRFIEIQLEMGNMKQRRAVASCEERRFFSEGTNRRRRKIYLRSEMEWKARGAGARARAIRDGFLESDG